jgi:hypothetical protein
VGDGELDVAGGGKVELGGEEGVREGVEWSGGGESDEGEALELLELGRGELGERRRSGCAEWNRSRGREVRGGEDWMDCSLMQLD